MGAMKDLIDERNRKEKMQNSILKWWNVHYMTPEELEEEQEKEHDPSVTGTKHQSDSTEAQDAHNPQEIMEHLEQAAKEQEAKKQQEIEAAMKEHRENYNPLTGSYSGSYGSSGVDSEHEDQIAAILTEKEDALRNLIEHADEVE